MEYFHLYARRFRSLRNLFDVGGVAIVEIAKSLSRQKLAQAARHVRLVVNVQQTSTLKPLTLTKISGGQDANVKLVCTCLHLAGHFKNVSPRVLSRYAFQTLSEDASHCCLEALLRKRKWKTSVAP